MPRALASEYDLFSVGSDQVWNLGWMRIRETSSPLLRMHRQANHKRAAERFLYWYFLGFCAPWQRIALAPSLGVDTLDAQAASALRRGVANFERLSVREQAGAELIRIHTGRDAQVICDPTMVLHEDEWRALADDRDTLSGEYVFTYLLGGVGDEADTVLDAVTRGGQVPVVALSDHMKPSEPPAGPAEFISLIDNAAHVVTDSFHAAVFSMLLETPLTITHRQGGVDMFSRLASLADTFGLHDKIYGDSSFDLEHAGSYPNAPAALRRERETLYAFLDACLVDLEDVLRT